MRTIERTACQIHPPLIVDWQGERHLCYPPPIDGWWRETDGGNVMVWVSGAKVAAAIGQCARACHVPQPVPVKFRIAVKRAIQAACDQVAEDMRR